MSLDTLKTAKKVIGIKQATKAITKGLVTRAYIAEDADKRLVTTLQQLCGQHNVSITLVPSMSELGLACGIEVGAAAVAVLK